MTLNLDRLKKLLLLIWIKLRFEISAVGRKHFTLKELKILFELHQKDIFVGFTEAKCG